MSSTNKTANLQLNQWVADDPVKREDFNADNAKVDAALAGLALTRLSTVTLSQNANSITVDLSGVPMADCREIIISAALRSTNDSSDTSCILNCTLNGLQANNPYNYVPLYETSGYSAASGNKLALNWGISSHRTSSYRVRLAPLPSAINGEIRGLNRYLGANVLRLAKQSILFQTEAVTAATLRSLEFTSANGFAAGCSYSVYVIKK